MTQPPEASPQDYQPSERALRRAQTAWQQSQEDLHQAQILLKQQQWLQGSFLCIQASTNALTAVCLLHGRYQFPLADTKEMLQLCGEMDSVFAALTDQCPALDQAAMENPFMSQKQVVREAWSLTPEQLGPACLAETRQILQVTRDFLHLHRQRFFKP